MKNNKVNAYEVLTSNELNEINGGNEWTDWIWENIIGKAVGAMVSGDTFRHEYGRTGYF